MYLAFFKWCFIKTFGGCFNFARKFREELKKGGHRGQAIAAFLLLSLLGFIVVGGLTLGLVDKDNRETASAILEGYFWTTVFTFVYNVVRAAFECFLEEREELIETLKK